MPVVVVDGGGGVVGVAFSCVPNGWLLGWKRKRIGPKVCAFQDFKHWRRGNIEPVTCCRLMMENRTECEEI